MTIRARMSGWFRGALLAMLVVIGGCGAFLGPDPANTPESNFEIFWESFDRHYAHFVHKDVDWDEVYRRYRPRVDSQTTDEELLEIFGEMIRYLEDGHVYVSAGEVGRVQSDLHLRGSRRNYDRNLINRRYILGKELSAGEGNFRYGWAGHSIGYVHLATLSGAEGIGDDVHGWIEDLDDILAYFKDAEGLVIDLRNNSGGRAFNTTFFASRFATDTRDFVVTRTRNGARHDAFSSPTVWKVSPAGPRQFTRPVVVLTNRYSFSAAEWLTLALRQYDHVTHIGTNSGGGLAMFLPRELPNGWHYTISVQETRDADGVFYERVGVPPHIHVENTPEDVSENRDAILEQAILHLKKQAGLPQR
ncbi:S41 family peptidase [Lujinxingia vulgaris]|uniref:S41 family peptidase n=1 Tax=Lujinxingia vulgaris TaxID=2600176 RepID=A0A5C6XIW2_9DELT|nr:S41 family peptidase [Lujinxingia vulgaris]TXD39458.1 S41 family peptidase [Lujinxingia vulgaris]